MAILQPGERVIPKNAGFVPNFDEEKTKALEAERQRLRKHFTDKAGGLDHEIQSGINIHIQNRIQNPESPLSEIGPLALLLVPGAKDAEEGVAKAQAEVWVKNYLAGEMENFKKLIQLGGRQEFANI